MNPLKSESGVVAERLDIEERVAIINALMEQDRIEIREHQSSVYQLTYLVVPAFAVIIGFYEDHNSLRGPLLIACVFILALYVVCFLIFISWLRDIRASLHIRESYYKDIHLVFADAFTPLRNATEEDYRQRMKDHALWLPFGVALLFSLASMTFIWLD
jgi:hypothetical protein